MKVAKKSPRSRLPGRNTLTLPADTYRAIDELRGELPRSSYIQSLIEREQRRRDRAEFLERVNAEYTPEVCAETLRVNAQYPIHGDA
ncbi:MAG: hypothetical protein ABMA13_01495 [Chthoniobacteraceae bacterium]